MRFFFCAIPALIAGLLGALILPFVGILFAAVFFFVGWQITEARADRGETK